MITTISVLTMLIMAAFALRLATIFPNSRNPYHLMLSIAAVAGMVAVLAWMNPPWMNQTGMHHEFFDISRAVGLSALLSGATWLIYRLKPAFVRFPVYFCYLPFILIALFPLLHDTGILIEIVYLIYQIGAILILLLLYSTRLDGNSGNIYILSGVIISAVSILMYWMPEAITEPIPHFVVPVPLALALILLTFGFDIRYKEAGNAMDENSIVRNMETS